MGRWGIWERDGHPSGPRDPPRLVLSMLQNYPQGVGSELLS